MDRIGAMTHVQTEVSQEAYERLRALADERGLTIREALREATERWIEEMDEIDPEDPLFTSVESVRDADRDGTPTRVTAEDDLVEEWHGDAGTYRLAEPE